MMKSGIYAIVNTLTGRRYIGSSVNMATRWRVHRYYLDAGKPTNRHLVSAWKKYGSQAFEFVVLEYVSDTAQLHVREQWHLDQYRPHVYNVGTVAASPFLGMKRDNGRLGVSHSDETKRRISKAQKGRKRGPFSESWRANISAGNIGKHVVSPEMAERTAQKNRGQKRSDETRRRLCEARAHITITPEWLDSLKVNIATAQQSLRDRTYCRNGHSYEDAYSQKGARRCRTCQKLAMQRYLLKKRETV